MLVLPEQFCTNYQVSNLEWVFRVEMVAVNLYTRGKFHNCVYMVYLKSNYIMYIGLPLCLSIYLRGYMYVHRHNLKLLN
jgi:hypothetical protein